MSSSRGEFRPSSHFSELVPDRDLIAITELQTNLDRVSNYPLAGDPHFLVLTILTSRPILSWVIPAFLASALT